MWGVRERVELLVLESCRDQRDRFGLEQFEKVSIQFISVLLEGEDQHTNRQAFGEDLELAVSGFYYLDRQVDLLLGSSGNVSPNVV